MTEFLREQDLQLRDRLAARAMTLRFKLSAQLKLNWNKTETRQFWNSFEKVAKLFSFSQNKMPRPSQPVTAEAFCFGWNIFKTVLKLFCFSFISIVQRV